MNGLLAIETSTDACSVAILRDGELVERHVVAPRQHNKLLFSLLEEVLMTSAVASAGAIMQPIDSEHFGAIAYGCGPGSFTGLRIAASAVQGLCYATGISAVPVSTLASLAQHALRSGRVTESDTVLCALDARIGEVYAAVYTYEHGLATLIEGPWVTPVGEFPDIRANKIHLVGDAGPMLTQLPKKLQDKAVAVHSDLLPTAQDTITQAQAILSSGAGLQSPLEVQPVYLRDEISWKKLAEQGKRS